MKTAGHSTVCCSCAPIIVAEYTRESDGSPVTVIVEALARATGVDQADLPPLYEVVDPDAINALFERHGGAENANALLSFRIDTWNVFVRGDGRIRICDATETVDPEPVFDRSLNQRRLRRSAGPSSGEASRSPRL